MPNITPGQRLLLLIEYYQGDSHKQTQLKKLYLSGAKNSDYCIALCSALLEEPLLRHYNIVIDENSITDDPSRRYFETHLAYQTLKHQLSEVDIHDICQLYHATLALADPKKTPSIYVKTINQVFKGELSHPTFKKRENYQYHFYIKRLKEASIFSKFSETDREKIKWIERVVYLSIVNGWLCTEMPLDIYNTERFRHRGRISRIDDQRSTRNQHFGLLKGHMPLSVDDIAFSDNPFMHIKSSDYSTFDSDSEAVQTCFQQLVHPFSNSISGCFLVQLRVLARLHNDSPNSFTENIGAFTQWLRLTISSGLYYSGGHSLCEYAAVLALPEIQDFFQYMPRFAEVNLEHIFYQDNETAFEQALEATIHYNKKWLQRQVLHRDLHASKDTFFHQAIPACPPPSTPSPIGVDELHHT